MNTRKLLVAVGVILIAVAAFMMLDQVWLRAHLGGADSQLQLAYAYGTGKGVDIDPVQATLWYRRAAEQGDVRAQLALAARYDAGEGVQEDSEQATQWYERAANQGSPAAQLALASRFREGLGAPKDDVRSAMWLILSDRYAASQTSGQNLLAELKASLDPDQLAEARQIAADWRAAHPQAKP